MTTTNKMIALGGSLAVGILGAAAYAYKKGYIPSRVKVSGAVSGLFQKFQQESDDVKKIVQTSIPLVEKVSKDFPVKWSVLISQKGIFTVPNTKNQVDLINKTMLMQDITCKSLGEACRFIEGDLICEYQRAGQDVPEMYYRKEGTDQFLKYEKREAPEGEKDQENPLSELQKKSSTTTFKVIDIASAQKKV